MLERCSHAHQPHAPPGATRMLERALDQLQQRLRQHPQVGNRREERESDDDGLGDFPHDGLGKHSRCQPP